MAVGRVLRCLLPALPLLLLGCKQEPVVPVVYSRLVIDTFITGTGGFTDNDTYLTLLDAGGNVLAEDDDGNPDQANHEGCSRIDYQGGLAAGTYYIKVHNPTDTGNPNYGIRVLDYDPGAVFPVIDPPAGELSDSDDAVDGNGLPTAPWDIALEEVVSRSLVPRATDVDWYRLVLP